jgi:hypothetical protein
LFCGEPELRIPIISQAAQTNHCSIMKALRCAKQLLEIISWRSEKVAEQ